MLAAIWLILIGWQGAEHLRVREAAHGALINRAKDISNTLGLVMRSQRRFGVISKERLETALKELVKPGELNSVALLNAAGEVVALAGAPIDLQSKGDLRQGAHWENQTVTLMNLIDLGTNVTQELERTNVTIILPRNEIPGFGTNRPAPPESFSLTNSATNLNSTNASGGRFHHSTNWFRAHGTNEHHFFGRPFWMSEADYKAISEKQGAHSFVLVMSTENLRAATVQDFWMRAVIGILAAISVIGSALAWRNLAKTSELQIRLVRASELNLHLKEMNLAAAGLAHETRNPLNIIRGLAQLICKQQDASLEIRKKSREIIDEADQLTAQLNEFINYSRPREVRRAMVDLKAVVTEVTRALKFDLEEKNIRLKVLDEALAIEADEQLLRQAIFNLVLNAIQAVDAGGEIEIRANKISAAEAVVEISDNGPGVAADHRTEIFKPYFTTREDGTGLGLAIVQQIVQAHGWEITCAAHEPRGALFRIVHVKAATPG